MAASSLLLLLVILLPAPGLTAHLDSGIVNGKEVKPPHSKPYMVSVQEHKAHICGGFLVSENFVMTAAHCHTGDLTVVVGAHNLTSRLTSPALRIGVKYYHTYPGYDKETLKNDIMLLQLEKAVPKSKDVKTIDLPKKDQDIKAKSVCNVAGWGATTTKGPASARLREVNVTVVDRKICQKLWKDDITTSIICAGDTNAVHFKGICQGDSGGPLVYKGKAVGIVSFTDDNCDRPKKPNGYTNISKYIRWYTCIMGGK